MPRAVACARSAWRCAAPCWPCAANKPGQRGLRIQLQAHAADVIGQRRGTRQLGLRRRVRLLGEQRLAAPAPRAGLDLAQAVGSASASSSSAYARQRPASPPASDISARPSRQRTVR